MKEREQPRERSEKELRAMEKYKAMVLMRYQGYDVKGADIAKAEKELWDVIDERIDREIARRNQVCVIDENDREE